jgi:DNA-binding IclR family transcriptional regulator
MRMGSDVTATARSVERAIAILELVDRTQRHWNISEIGRRLQIPKSTTHVLMLTLEKNGYVTRVQTSHRYCLGLKARELGNETTLRETLGRASLPRLEAVAAQTKLTAHVAIREEQQAVYIQKAARPGFVQFETYSGKRTNLHCTAVGKILLAFAPEDFKVQFLSKGSFMKHTSRTITATAQLRKELEKIRRQRYAADDEEEEIDVRCLAVPIFRSSGECIAALSITGTVSQIGAENSKSLTAIITRAANEIGKNLWPF